MRPGRALLALAFVLVLAGCADTQPGDQNPGAGYTNNVSDLEVKIPALQADPCRTNKAGALFGNCGRYVTEVANTIGALRAELPGQAGEINTLQAAVNSYQKTDCDSVNGATQQSDCPKALTSIGTELDRISQALASLPTN
ncbi:MAG TPA: hypothetical protein VH333_15710 [Pseudonocardiaceae bacterium]|jgi:hypothetical protein|nr:hypothetical protein [Pseudonocardiaceae bacterium]